MASESTKGAARLTWIIATRNLHKVEEIRQILGDMFGYRTLKDVPDAPAVVEDAPDFAGNATKKTLTLAKWISHASNIKHQGETWILADDSGLEVDALGG